MGRPLSTGRLRCGGPTWTGPSTSLRRVSGTCTTWHGRHRTLLSLPRPHRRDPSTCGTSWRPPPLPSPLLISGRVWPSRRLPFLLLACLSWQGPPLAQLPSSRSIFLPSGMMPFPALTSPWLNSNKCDGGDTVVSQEVCDVEGELGADSTSTDLQPKQHLYLALNPHP